MDENREVSVRAEPRTQTPASAPRGGEPGRTREGSVRALPPPPLLGGSSTTSASLPPRERSMGTSVWENQYGSGHRGGLCCSAAAGRCRTARARVASPPAEPRT